MWLVDDFEVELVGIVLVAVGDKPPDGDELVGVRPFGVGVGIDDGVVDVPAMEVERDVQPRVERLVYDRVDVRYLVVAARLERLRARVVVVAEVDRQAHMVEALRLDVRVRRVEAEVVGAPIAARAVIGGSLELVDVHAPQERQLRGDGRMRGAERDGNGG